MRLFFLHAGSTQVSLYRYGLQLTLFSVLLLVSSSVSAGWAHGGDICAYFSDSDACNQIVSWLQQTIVDH